MRALLEGIAYQYPELLDVVVARGLDVVALTISDGEARSEVWNQIKADVMGGPIVPALRVEAPSIGAAILAGMGADLFASVEEAVAVSVDRAAEITPDPVGHEAYRDLRARWNTVRDEIYPGLRAKPADVLTP